MVGPQDKEEKQYERKKEEKKEKTRARPCVTIGRQPYFRNVFFMESLDRTSTNHASSIVFGKKMKKEQKTVLP
jgi:hypothetical protein